MSKNASIKSCRPYSHLQIICRKAQFGLHVRYWSIRIETKFVPTSFKMDPTTISSKSVQYLRSWKMWKNLPIYAFTSFNFLQRM